MQLQYPPFAACSAMVAASRNAPPLRLGARGTAVGLLQGGLIQLGFKLPYSTLAKGVPDAIFGDETFKVLRQFQERHKSQLVVDGIAGRNTVTYLDSLLFAASKQPPFHPPPKPPPQMTATYVVGRGDPPLAPDPGAGRWNSSPKQASYVALGASIVAALPVAYGVIGDDAAAHLTHYFGNLGSRYTIDLEGMVREVASAKTVFENEVAEARELVETLPPGRHDIASRQTQDGYNLEDENRNWYFAIGGYHAWGSGSALVTDVGGERHFELDFEYKFHDRYNWDNGKAVTIAGITITDKFMGEFHRQGLAQEFDCVGSFRRKFNWKRGTGIPAEQLQPSGGRA
jgi:hypothetical protein